jgi:hypothetical protein
MNELKVCAFELESISGKSYREVLGIRRDYFRTARSIVSGVLEHYGSTGLDANLATLNLFGTLNWIFMWYDRKRNPSAEQMVDQITNLFLFGLASDASREDRERR